MRILVIGSGGREHALAWKIAQSPLTDKLFVAPGNAGTAKVAENVPIDIADHAAVVAFAQAERIDFVVVGPDSAVVAGLGDDVRDAGIDCFAPSRAAAQIEGSKGFTKRLCDRMGIPTAAYAQFDVERDALNHLAGRAMPVVIKADGLATGKGVVIAQTREEAIAAIRACFDGAFGDAGSSVVIEDFLDGEEASLFVLCDGENTLVLAGAQDHKCAFDGDTGPNTGGMGAYSPAPILDAAMTKRVMADIVEPTFRGLAEMGMPYRGVLFVGLMITADGPRLIEHNARFGDPETQVLMMRLASDLVPLLQAAATGSLAGMSAEWRKEAALTVAMATMGYPGDYDKGSEIRGAEALDGADLLVFHAGTRRDGDRLLASGGRVLNVTALGETVSDAQKRAYAAIAAIDWPEGYCRRDIGWRAVARESAGTA